MEQVEGENNSGSNESKGKKDSKDAKISGFKKITFLGSPVTKAKAQFTKRDYLPPLLQGNTHYNVLTAVVFAGGLGGFAWMANKLLDVDKIAGFGCSWIMAGLIIGMSLRLLMKAKELQADSIEKHRQLSELMSGSRCKELFPKINMKFLPPLEISGVDGHFSFPVKVSIIPGAGFVTGIALSAMNWKDPNNLTLPWGGVLSIVVLSAVLIYLCCHMHLKEQQHVNYQLSRRLAGLETAINNNDPKILPGLLPSEIGLLHGARSTKLKSGKEADDAYFEDYDNYLKNGSSSKLEGNQAEAYTKEKEADEGIMNDILSGFSPQPS